MAANSKAQSTGPETLGLLQSSDERPNQGFGLGLGLGFLDSLEKPPSFSLPPPCVEVLPSASSLSGSVKYTVDEVNLGSVTLLKGRVSTQEVFSLSNSDLVPGKYEGGLKLWEGSLDLVRALDSELGNGNVSFEGKTVLELGCGHGLPGIFACLKGATVVHFQDFNHEVLRCLTLPNVHANLLDKLQALDSDSVRSNVCPEIRFFAGDWSEVNNILPNARSVMDSSFSHTDVAAGYNVILMAETVYSVSALNNLYNLIKMCISRPNGIVYMAAKKHYFGVGGGTRCFLSIAEKDGSMVSSLVAEVADGSSNVREVWKLSCK